MVAITTRLEEIVGRLDNFNSDDEHVLGAFLKPEHDENPVFDKYGQWEALIWTPEMFEKPTSYVREILDSAPVEEGISHWIPKLLKDVYTTLPDLIFRLAELQVSQYEAIVKSAWKLASERRMHPAEFLSEKSSRDQVYRLMFPTSEAFLQSQADFNEAFSTTLSNLRTFVESINNGEIRMSFIKRLCVRLITKHSMKIPREEVAAAYFSEQMDYARNRADEIYVQG